MYERRTRWCMKPWSKPHCSCITVASAYITRVTGCHSLQVRSRWMHEGSVAAFSDACSIDHQRSPSLLTETRSMYDPVASAGIRSVNVWPSSVGRNTLGNVSILLASVNAWMNSASELLHTCYCHRTFSIYTTWRCYGPLRTKSPTPLLSTLLITLLPASYLRPFLVLTLR